MLKKLKVTFMTTLGVNVGDEFIREGIGSFLDEIYDDWTPFYVNKHNLATLHERVEDEQEVLKDKFCDADIIIQAGTPVYWKLGESASYNVEWAEELWRRRIFRLGPAKSILNIAAGACQPFPDTAETFLTDPACVKFAEEVSAACRWTSVRDPLASQILQALNLEHDILPCTAFHAARRIRSAYELNSMLGINLMPLGGHYKFKDDIDSKAWSGTIEKILADLRKRHRLLFIAHDLKEKEFMGHYIAAGETIFISEDYHAYMAVYAQCAAVLANRVHGAVCAAGFGRPSVIIGNDTRLQIGDYIGIPALYVAEVSAGEIIYLLEKGLAGSKNERDRLITLREESAGRYRAAIIENIEAMEGKSRAAKLKGKPGFASLNMQTAPEQSNAAGAARLKNESGIPGDIKKILVPRFDTLGDIVLLEGFLEALLERFPQAEIVLLVREGYEQLSPLFPQKIRWATTSFNPYRGLDESRYEELTLFLDELSGASWDLLLSTTFNRTWLDELIAARLDHTVSMALGGGYSLEEWKRRLFLGLELKPECPYDRVLPLDEKLHETAKYRELGAELFKDACIPLPRLIVPEGFKDKAEALLSGMGLSGKAFFVCLPFGTANVPIKAWPAEGFLSLVEWIKREYKLDIIIAGHEGERDGLKAMAASLKEKGMAPHLWIGKDGEIPVLAAIMHKASLYLGNDSGPMHIAAALGVPVIGIFGGGTWPRFLPAEDRSVAVAGELPCFGCMWDCIFEDAPCMRLVSVEDLKEAVKLIFGKKDLKAEILRASKKITLETAEFIEKTVKSFRSAGLSYARRLEESEADRAARLEVIEEQNRVFTGQLSACEADRAARLEVIEEQNRVFTGQLSACEADRAARLEVIHKLGAQLQDSEAARVELEAMVVGLCGELEAVHKSLTWRATGPLRGIFDKLKSSY